MKNIARIKYRTLLIGITEFTLFQNHIQHLLKKKFFKFMDKEPNIERLLCMFKFHSHHKNNDVRKCKKH